MNVADMAFQYVKSEQVLINGELIPAVVQVKDGKIAKIYTGAEYDSWTGSVAQPPASEVLDAGTKVVMPGLVDTHTHVDEPGREDWEGFWTATRAAAAGGFTTIIDMPLQCNPPTTTVDNLNLKVTCATGKCHVNVGFWGGAIGNPEDMKALLKAGVCGFKCFLIDTTFPEFPHLDEQTADEALEALKGTGSVLQFHAELATGEPNPTEGVEHYPTVMKWRPASMELEAIKLVDKLCRKHKDVRCHIVHLANADALDIIKKCKDDGFPLTVETCPHYLKFSDMDIGTGWTEYLCLPPIRDAFNREGLWRGIAELTIDSIAADHANCTPSNKPRDFLQSWGGIAGLQFGLPVVWTNGRKRGFSVTDVWRLMSYNTAALAGLSAKKGDIKEGFDADFVVWEPDEEIAIETKNIHFKNKMTPYHGMKFLGRVYKTIIAGNVIYDGEDGIFAKPQGQLIFQQY